MKQRINNRSGFSLIELVMVMILLFIIAGITIPYLAAGLPSARIKSGANQIYAALHMGRNDAATYGFRTRLVVNQEENTWRLDYAADHFIGTDKEVEVVRTIAISQGEGKGVAIPAPGTPDPLKVAGLVGWY